MAKDVDTNSERTQTGPNGSNPPEALAGSNHPFMQVADASAGSGTTSGAPASVRTDDFTNAREVVTNANGQTTEQPLQGKLTAGDHTLQFANGRQFVVHVPPNDGRTEMPVMFVMSPSVHTNQGYDAKNFETETGMNQYADQDKFVVVYADAANHLLGASSKLPAEAWNAPGSGINDADMKHAGYNDEDYIKSIVNMMPGLANIDTSHKNWGALAFSQGSMFLNQLQHDMPHLFPTVGLVGSSFQDGHDYTTAPGNSNNVMIVNLHGDHVTLPFPGEESTLYKAEKAASAVVNGVTENPRDWFGSQLSNGEGTAIAERADPLGAIDNRDQNPQRQEDFYIHNMQMIGPLNQYRTQLNTPVASPKKDVITSYRVTSSDHALDIVDLATADHSYPGPDHGKYVNSTKQYQEFDTSKYFSQGFMNYNEAEKKRQEGDE